MKKLYFLILMAVTAITATAQTVGEAFYIYRNDGGFNAFFRDEVDSIAYSHYDLDSLYYDENVTQLVYTQDSLYRIPLAAIDSVSFVQPPTVYKDDVTRLEYNLLDFVIGADGLTLKLKLETPNSIIPVKGDKLVLLEGCDALPYGFSGIVANVQTGSSSIDVVCEQAYLEDLFDSFCSVSTVYGVNSDTEDATRFFPVSGRRRVTYSPSDFVFSLGSFKINRSYEVSQGLTFNGDLALTGGASFAIELEPTFKIHTFLIVGEGQGTYFQYGITGNLRVSSQSSLYGGLSYNHDFDGAIAYCPIPETGNMVNFYINPGLFVRADATITSSITSTQNYTFGSAFDFSSKGLNTVKPSIGGRLASSTVDMSGSLDGSLAGGAYIEIGFNLLSREIARVCVRGEIGARFSGSFVLRNNDIAEASKDTKLYERLRTSSVDLSAFVNVSLQASVAHTSNGLTWELSAPIHSWNLAPTFSNTKLTKTAGSKASVDAYTEISGDCIPVGVGYKLFDKDKNEVGNYDAGVNYTNKARDMKHTFAGLGEEKYKVYPKVRLFDRYDVLASPSAELNMHFPVTLSDFKVTKSQYKQNGFTHEGVAYDYRFDVSVNATLDDDAENIADWGYVYLDPNGREAFISLKQFGSSYTDTRWAYYRNGTPPFTCTLYGYVQYVGSDEIIYGEPHDYPLEYGETTCPDSNHPHMIDLGLPSGTKWACCNVGASAPEQYGNYYAWGETSPKSLYNDVNYSYYTGLDTDGDGWIDKNFSVVNIGSDIAGTQYDAATANWGAPWRMPSLTQIRELLDNCTFTRTIQNGVDGRKFTGPNGGTIFLPGAGAHWNGELSYSGGSNGYYWSSTLGESRPDCAGILMFHSGGAYWSSRSGRYGGLPVRPVRQN